MKLLTTKQLVRIGRVLCCFDLEGDDYDKLSEEEKQKIADSIYPEKQKINKDTLTAAKNQSVNKFTKENIVDKIRNGIYVKNVANTDVSFFTNLRGLFAHYAYDIDISGWTFADNANCSYMFAFSEFDQWEHLPIELREELISPQRGIDTTGIFHGCKGEKKFYQEIEEERKKRNITLLN